MDPSSSMAAKSDSVGQQPTRRSSRRRAAASQQQQRGGPTPSIRGLPITAFRRPWTQHYIDIGHCRLTKCTQRIRKAKESDIQHLSTSFLAMAIKASTAYGPKWKQEQLLVEYTQAVVERGISPNDRDQRLGSAVSMAAYFGYPRLLKLLLDAGCPITGDGEPHALRAAVKNTQHPCIELLLKERPEEVREQLHQESLASWRVTKPTTMKVAMAMGDVQVVKLLRQEKAQVLILFQKSNKKRWTTMLQELHPSVHNVRNWSQELHWSFPGADRRTINWLWHALQKQQQLQQDNQRNALLPSEIWLRIFGFIGRGWWSLAALGDQNGLEDLAPSMRG